MAKVLRLQNKNLSNNILGWGNSVQYGFNEIADIKDPAGMTASKPITSIPSPFAQMELVKTAFKYVSEKDGNGNYINIDGNTIYHKLVSDALDVGQIFFTYERWAAQGIVEIIDWDRTIDLSKFQDGTPEHKLLGDTYNLFLTQDAQTYNFANMNHIYLLNFKKGKNQINIIGATSPCTLFMGVSNDMSAVGNFINFGNDKPFDNQYMPLYKRDINYQEYLIASSKTPNFNTLFPEFYSYIQSCYSLTNGANNQLNNIERANLENYTNVGNAGNPVSILGIDIKQEVLGPIQNSDFEIVPTMQINGSKPLVLPITKFTKPYRYTISNWDAQTNVPYFDTKPLNQRILPGDGRMYPYLTIGDFLEDTIIQLRNPLNRNSFYGSDTATQYLLPLKREFFDYFTVDDVLNGLNNETPLISMNGDNNSVRVTLNIPIQKNSYIEYSRVYYAKNSPNSAKNQGAIEEVSLKFAMALMPLIKSPDVNIDYRIALISEFIKAGNYSLDFYDSANKLINNQGGAVYRNTNISSSEKCAIYNINQSFDYINLSINKSCHNVIIPKFVIVENGNNDYTFAIDLGTTNTHIEYKSTANNAQAFDITKKDPQIVYLSESCTQLSTFLFDSDFLPSIVGNQEMYSFPTRTALNIGGQVNWDSATFPLVHANMAFTYEKRSPYTYNVVETNLKWSNHITNQLMIQCYIDNLMWLIRNKVLMNNGNLANTKIIWFYPISMTSVRYNAFAAIWQKSYQNYIGQNLNNIISMTESETPYNYYKNAGTISDNMVTIDIGGETSDIVFANNNKINYITSFRFASNAIYSDGYGGTYSPLNGMIQYYKENINDKLKSNGLDDLISVYNSVMDSGNSANIASFFYSLYSNKNIQDKHLVDRLDFNKMLQNDGDFKLIFIVFYTAIVYHVSKIIKSKDLILPRYIAFSGKGAQILRILDPQISNIQESSSLSNYTRIVIENVVGRKYSEGENFQVKYALDPKVVTCKGGLVNPIPTSYNGMIGKKVVLLGTKDMNYVSNDFTYSSINDSVKNDVVDEVKSFFDFMFGLNKQFSFKNNFGIEDRSYSIAKIKCYEDLSDYLNKGLVQRMEEVASSDVLEETLFFYPINGILNALAKEIFNIKSNELI